MVAKLPFRNSAFSNAKWPWWLTFEHLRGIAYVKRYNMAYIHSGKTKDADATKMAQKYRDLYQPSGGGSGWVALCLRRMVSSIPCSAFNSSPLSCGPLSTTVLLSTVIVLLRTTRKLNWKYSFLMLSLIYFLSHDDRKLFSMCIFIISCWGNNDTK